MSQVTRRLFFKYVAAAGAAGAGFALLGPDAVQPTFAAQGAPPFPHGRKPRQRFNQPRPARQRASAAADEPVPGGTLDPNSIPKYVTPLLIPPALPVKERVRELGGKNADYYEISLRQFQQQILPAPLPATTVWGYGVAGQPATHHAPSFTIEAEWNRPVRVKWINELVDAAGNSLPHLLPVDQTIHWANPPGPRDSRGSNPEPYRGPVPMVTHLHGGHAGDESDGFPEAWYLPAANNIPGGYSTEGTWYNTFKQKFQDKFGEAWQPGSATFEYPNDQDAATLWYHDHVLGLTRVNVYAGPAGFYLLRGGPRDNVGGKLPGPAPKPGDAPGTRYYEIPIVIQDRSFNADGSLFFPGNRAFFEGLEEGQLQIPFVPDTACGGPSDISPIWNPEFFGNTMMVNGNTWPYLEVEPRRYRFRFLNACNARAIILTMDNGLPFYQIGAEGGFLPQPVQLSELLLAPAERADVIVDFTGLQPGAMLILRNIGPDEPFGGGEPGGDFDMSDPQTTGQVMQFRVVPLSGKDKSKPPMQLKLPGQRQLPAASRTRQVSLNEASSATVLVAEHEDEGALVLACEDEGAEFFGPQSGRLGLLGRGEDGMPMGMPMMWGDPVTENPAPNTTELWEIYNFTEDAHPIHLHQVQFEVVNREIFDPMAGEVGKVTGPAPGETGRTDTVIAYPGQITRIKAQFDLEGLYVWHCHIIDHEDNEMMRPLAVGAPSAPR